MMEKLEDKWEEIRSQLHTVWHDLTTTDLETIQDSMYSGIAFLKEKYNTTEEIIVEKFEEIWRKTKEFKDDL